VIAVVVALLDQGTKYLAVQNLTLGESVEVFGRFFMLTLIYNLGGAMGTNFGTPTYYLISSILILVLVVVYAWFHRDQWRILFPLGLVAGGAIGNIVDRIAYGKVVDFLDFDFFNMNLFGYQIDRWWTFNIADAAISVAIVLLFINIIFLSPNKDEQQSSSEPSPEIPPYGGQI